MVFLRFPFSSHLSGVYHAEGVALRKLMQLQLCPDGGHGEVIRRTHGRRPPAPGAGGWPAAFPSEDYLVSVLRPASIWEKTRKLVSAGVV